MSSPTGTVKAEGIMVPDFGRAPPKGCPMHQDVNKSEMGSSSSSIIIILSF